MRYDELVNLQAECEFISISDSTMVTSFLVDNDPLSALGLLINLLNKTGSKLKAENEALKKQLGTPRCPHFDNGKCSDGYGIDDCECHGCKKD